LIDPSNYQNREQTYVKHLFLDSYLDRVAHVTLAKPSGWNEFTYIDGFSGPWKTQSEDFNDTSVHIALSKLRQVRQNLVDARRNVHFRAIFVERDKAAYEKLKAVTSQFRDIEVITHCGDFHEVAADCAHEASNSFSLAFIDPTSYAIDLGRMSPLFRLRGEVIINFMYAFLRRFMDNPDYESSLRKTFASETWRADIESAHETMPIEEAVVDVFTDAVRRTGNHRHVTSTRIIWPSADRTYFYLVYATNHWRGLAEFRTVEGKMAPIQELVRSEQRASARSEKFQMDDLFSPTLESPESTDLRRRRTRFEEVAEERLDRLLAKGTPILGKQVFEALLELPLITPQRTSELVLERVSRGLVTTSLVGRQRMLRAETEIRLA